MYLIPLKFNLVKNYNQFPFPTKVMKIRLEENLVRRTGFQPGGHSFQPSIFNTKYGFILMYVLLYISLILNTFALGLLNTFTTTRGVHILKFNYLCQGLTESIVNPFFSFSVYVNYWYRL